MDYEIATYELTAAQRDEILSRLQALTRILLTVDQPDVRHVDGIRHGVLPASIDGDQYHFDRPLWRRAYAAGMETCWVGSEGCSCARCPPPESIWIGSNASTARGRAAPSASSHSSQRAADRAGCPYSSIRLLSATQSLETNWRRASALSDAGRDNRSRQKGGLGTWIHP